MKIEHYVVIRGPKGEKECRLQDFSEEKRKELKNTLNEKFLGQLNYIKDKTA